MAVATLHDGGGVRVYPASLRPHYGQVAVLDRSGHWLDIRYGPDFSGRYTLVEPATGEAFAAVFTDSLREVV